MNIKTIEFIEKAKKVHGDRYSYDSVEYINNHIEVIIVCKRHGIFTQAPSRHLRGSNCRKCAHTITTEEFVAKVSKVHNNRYNYLNTVFNGAAQKIEINCNIHGSFTQKAQSHLRGVGCPKCANESRSKKLMHTNETFIEKAVEIHGDKYDYSKVECNGSAGKITIFCNIHGEFLQTPKAHLNGNGCQKCGKTDMAEKATKTTEQFIYEANLVHNGVYLYDQVNYIKGIEKIDILCTTHGLFKQTPNGHLNGRGCSKCKNEKNAGGFGKNDYIKLANGRTCTFYTLRCFNEEEEFYKIGITMNTPKIRYQSTRTMPYEYEVINEVKGSAGFIWDLELSEKRKLKSLHYRPEIDFGGSVTECFTDYKI